MRIWVAQVGEPIPLRPGVRRQRLTLLCEALVRRGHEVVRWGSAFDHITKTWLSDRSTEIVRDGVTVRLLRGLGYRRNVSVRRYLDHQAIAWRFQRSARQLPSPDCLLVATPPHMLAAAGVRWATRRGVPVVVDIRDQWPDLFVDLAPPPLRRLVRGGLARDFALMQEALRGATAITAMMSDLLAWGLDTAGRARTELDRVYYIGTPRAEAVDPAQVAPALRAQLDRLAGKVVVTFVGTFNRYYNPLIVVEAARRLAARGRPEVAFVLAGDGGLGAQVRQAARGLENVLLTGWLQHEDIIYLLQRSHLAICPLHEDRPCFPNKIFMYMSAGLPVVSSLTGDFQVLAEKHGLGLPYRRGDVDSLVSAIDHAVAHPTLVERMRRNIQEMFAELFDAEHIYDDFAVHLERVAAGTRTRPLAPTGVERGT
jgi:glycosyltransferase involved in cell wall biosynthesis